MTTDTFWKACAVTSVLPSCAGKEGMIVSDNGTELTSKATLRWSKGCNVEWHYIAPGKTALITWLPNPAAFVAEPDKQWPASLRPAGSAKQPIASTALMREATTRL